MNSALSGSCSIQSNSGWAAFTISAICSSLARTTAPTSEHQVLPASTSLGCSAMAFFGVAAAASRRIACCAELIESGPIGEQHLKLGKEGHVAGGCGGTAQRMRLAQPRFSAFIATCAIQLNNLRVDEQRRFWIAYPEAKEDSCDIREDLGQEGTEVNIVLPMSTTS